MQQLRGMKHFDIVPISFMLPLEYRDLLHAHRSGHKGPWIVKVKTQKFFIKIIFLFNVFF